MTLWKFAANMCAFLQVHARGICGQCKKPIIITQFPLKKKGAGHIGYCYSCKLTKSRHLNPLPPHLSLVVCPRYLRVHCPWRQPFLGLKGINGCLSFAVNQIMSRLKMYMSLSTLTPRTSKTYLVTRLYFIRNTELPERLSTAKLTSLCKATMNASPLTLAKSLHLSSVHLTSSILHSICQVLVLHHVDDVFNASFNDNFSSMPYTSTTSPTSRLHFFFLWLTDYISLLPHEDAKQVS